MIRSVCSPMKLSNPQFKLVGVCFRCRWYSRQHHRSVWSRLQQKSQHLGSAICDFKSGWSYQWAKVRNSIQEANKRFNEQEKDGFDTSLSYDKDVATNTKIKGLPSELEHRRHKWSRRLEFYMGILQDTLFTATRAFDDVTGYSSIQKLRKSIELLETDVARTKSTVKRLKADYSMAIETRTNSQRQLNELLQRKSSWSPNDLETFTKLYKDDAYNMKKEQDLKQQVADIEKKLEVLNDDLYRAILTRYHEEQIWSNKIRRVSSWNTYMLIGVNIFLFVVIQILLEPWRRKRLVGNFEDKVEKAIDKYTQKQQFQINNILETLEFTKEKPDNAISDTIVTSSFSTLLQTYFSTLYYKLVRVTSLVDDNTFSLADVTFFSIISFIASILLARIL